MSGIEILIVEDESIVAVDIADCLGQMGYSVADIVHSGEEAIAAATTLQPDLILMDIKLAGELSGTEAGGVIWSQLQIPVIYLTAYADEDTLHRAKLTGPFGYILKPFEERELRVTIEISISRHKAEVETQKALATALTLQQEAEAHKQQQSDYLSMASHEFRTPLSTISLAAEVLRRRSHLLSEDEKQEHLYYIQNAAESMNQLLKDVLTLGKADSAKSQCNPVYLDVVHFCKQLTHELQWSIGKQHQLVLLSDAESVTAFLDEQLLWHLFSNLLSNAIKYSPPKSEILLKLGCQAGEICFQVQDQGIGIPPADQENLFEPFQRATNVGEVPGTGLGLAIVKRSVELQGGQITVESTVGKGTTFTVTLPLRVSSNAENKEPPHPELAADESKDELPRAMLRKAIEYINMNLNQDLTLPVIAEQVGMSQYYFCRLFKESMSITPHQYVIQQRVERAKQLLKQRELSIADIAFQCGFSHQSHLTRHFRQNTGMTPKIYREM
ncbi:MAG: helix-turn-helix domain-containing protein [Cyanothece sp. SIO1E1]|nr:helix-turn-helix domain-containing protein [Cyanothece sp. SIO1E1]